MIRILVVCSRNKKRSLTAEKMYIHDIRALVRSVGTSPSAKRKITQADITWADVILCMENKHQHMIETQFKSKTLPKIIVLDIEDEYEYMSADLVQMLKNEIEEIIKKSF